MQRFVQRLFEFFPKPIPKPLGRWGRETCHARLDQKIDLSNEDHCGPCGQYALTKNAFSSNADATNDPEIWTEPRTKTQLDASAIHANGARPRLFEPVETRHSASRISRRNMFVPGLMRQSVRVPHYTVRTHVGNHAMTR